MLYKLTILCRLSAEYAENAAKGPGSLRAGMLDMLYDMALNGDYECAKDVEIDCLGSS